MDVDVAVVGAGIVGGLTARAIVQREPRVSVALLDRDTVAGGASRWSAGLHCPRGATPRVREMTGYSEDFYATLKRAVPDLPIRRVRMSVLASATAPQLGQLYLERSRLTRTDAVAEEDVGVPDGVGVWRCEGSQYADVYGLTHALVRGLRRYVDVREGVRVTALDASESGVRLRLGTGEVLTAGKVVLAPGPWLAAPAWRELLRPVGARVKRVVALHLNRTPSASDGVVYFQDEDAFLLPLVDQGYWLYSFTSTIWDPDPDSAPAGLSDDDVEEARQCLRRYAPLLLGDRVSGRVFCDAYSGTGEPVVRTVHPTGRVVFAGAANGSGYRLAPAMASEAAALLYPPRSMS